MLDHAQYNNRTLAEDLQSLYDQIKAKVGDEDLSHIQNVAAYSKAIKARSEELIKYGGKPNAMMRGVALRALHTLLEFAELGHNIMHGSYDHLPNAGKFHSEQWVWDFVIDPREWRVMHHQNHHPFTNVIGLDHDLGYSFLRAKSGQSWFGHHVIQFPLIWAIAISPGYFFTLYTATSAARTEGRKILSKETFAQSYNLIKTHALKNFVTDALSVPKKRVVPTLVGNYLATVFGYDLTVAMLFLEHHAPNVQIFTDPGPNETQEEYFRRQILGTSNFTSYPVLDNYFKNLLDEEVVFDNPPPFNVFYGGLDTHLEHHIFPDLPCNRQREIRPLLKEICLKHGLPYNITPFEQVVPDMIANIFKLTTPAGDLEHGNPLNIIKKPSELIKRLKYGMKYKLPDAMTYLNKPLFYNIPVKVLGAYPQTEGQALMLRLEKPKDWDNVMWEAGAFISVRIQVGAETLVRQYSLLRDSADAKDSLEITVKRVEGGRVSNYINDHIKKDAQIILVGAPQSSPDFIMTDVPKQTLFLAGGVGITPIISMMRKAHREAPNSHGVLLYFNRNERSIIFEHELREIADESGFTVHFICDQLNPNYVHRKHMQQSKLSPDLLSELVPALTEREVYVCAPPGFINAAKSMLLDLGLPEQQFHTESFIASTVEHPTDGKDHVIQFARSGIEITVDGGVTLLEAAKKAGINIPSGCERGLCKACVCTKLEGTTNLDENKQQPDRRITTCNSLPRSEHIVLDI